MSKHQKGVLLIILSALSFSLMNLFVKMAGPVPSIQKSCFRNMGALIIASIILYKNHVSFRWKREDFKLLFIRSSVGTIGILCNFYALSNINLSDATILNKLSPFFTIIFSYFFLKEKITLKQIGFILMAFWGSLLIIKPGFAFDSTIPALIGFLGGVAAGGAYTAVRAMGIRKVNPNYIVFFFSAFSSLVTLPYVIITFAPMTIGQVICLIFASIFGAGGQFTLTAAYSYAPAKEISLYDYTIVVFAGLWSFLFWKELPDTLSLIGYLFIFGSSFLMFMHNRKQAKLS